MANYTETSEVDQVTVDPATGLVLWRTTTRVFRDGVEISKTFERGSRAIDDDVSQIPPDAKRVRDLFDTPALRQKMRDKRAADVARFNPKSHGAP